ncbi:MAG: ABC transporter permease subunit [Chitinivibrionales bacterium]|nr:ABC transporter permease subunit [Chitinivibrionales bacterium]MBD3357867.1 ABC transporter permease subunit [Chitinivibrionales bacterium]
MNHIILMIKKEWDGFRASDIGSFAVYGILVLAWSALIAGNLTEFGAQTSALWLVFLSVIVSGNFAATVFVAERMTGSLEVLLTSGISRPAILAGKIAYIVIMSLALGTLCYLLALVWAVFGGTSLARIAGTIPIVNHAFLFGSACYMNASSGAWLSMHLSNPRLSNFANLLVLALVISVHAALAELFNLPLWVLPSTLLVIGLIFQIAATRAFKSERVIQPLSL